jgi:hypothetical protein
LRHQRPLAQEALATPVEVLGVETEAAVQLGKRLERLDTLRDDLLPNPVTRQDRDLIVVHGSSSLFVQ